jgi:hypothetical protein
MAKVIVVTVPSNPVDVITVQAEPNVPKLIEYMVPGLQGPAGLKGDTGAPGPADVISIGTTTTGLPGSSAVATITGATPSRKLNLTIPQGPVGATGPTNILTIGTVTDTAAGGQPAATLTGTSPNQVLNLVLPRGASNALSLGTVTTGAEGTQASASITGTAPNQVISLTIPRGNTGAQGPSGTIASMTATSLAAGASPTVTLSGTPENRIITLGIPKGDKGDQGIQGIQGIKGDQGIQGIQGVKGDTGNTGSTGPSNVLTIGTVTTGAAGSSAAASITGTSPSQALNLTIPTGPQGPKGNDGYVGADGKGVVILGANEPIPANTPVNTVIFRPAVKQHTYFWGSGTVYPTTGLQTGDTFIHTTLQSVMRYNGAAWRQVEPAELPTTAARDALPTNLLHAGFQALTANDSRYWKWNGTTWLYVSGGTGAPIFDVTFVNGWSNWDVNFGSVRYYKDTDGAVNLQGLLKTPSAAITASTVIAFVLPVGFRPTVTELFWIGDSNGVLRRFDIPPDGSVQAVSPVPGASIWLPMNTMKFHTVNK